METIIEQISRIPLFCTNVVSKLADLNIDKNIFSLYLMRYFVQIAEFAHL